MLEAIMNKLGYVKAEVSYNAEKRALTHFTKLSKIEYITRNAIKTKEPAVFTVDKIKNVIYCRQTNR